jgi:glycosyltransferase involved in cell wall biosynthesis
VLSEEARVLGLLADELGIHVASPRLAWKVREQSIFHLSHFGGLGAAPPAGSRLGVAYFHGRPGTPGYPEFDEAYAALRERHERLARVQVSHSEVHDLVLAAGIDPAKVHRIPIGIDEQSFRAATEAERLSVREALGLPAAAFVLGSFQKDGMGWDEGMEPKLIKGPDVFLEVARRVQARVPELYVLLTGPARGYVKRGLDAAGIPYRHVHASSYAELPRLYRALDAYAIASRQEGGPKALLEAMAAGVPVVTTPVGQAMDLAVDGVNAFVAPVEDAGALADAVVRVHDGAGAALLGAARTTAEEHAYTAQLPLWRRFFEGFVELGRGT